MDLERIEGLLRTRPPRERTYDRRLPDLAGASEPVRASVRVRTWRGSSVGSKAAAMALVLVVVAIAALYGAWHQSQPVAVATPSSTATSSNPSATGTATATSSAPPSASPSPTLVPPVYSTAPPAGSHHLVPWPVGFAGTWAWTLSDSGLSISEDSGVTWSGWSLPSALVSSDVMTVAAAPGRGVWLAVDDGQGVRLYRRPALAAAWSSTTLMPGWTTKDDVYPGQKVERVIVTPGPAALVTVAESIGFGMSTAIQALFVSTDNGKTFVHRRPTGDGCVFCFWNWVDFTTPKSGVIISGPSTLPNQLLYTSDGGTTWSNSTVAGLPAAANRQFDSPVIVGSDIEVPMTAFSDDGTTTTFSILVSHDGGATFTQLGTALTEYTGYAGFTSDTLGKVTWVVSGGTIYVTNDGAQTWSSFTPAGFSASSIHLTGPNSALAAAGQGGCASFKTDCWSQNWLIGTTDGGRTWTDL
jgi:hypothetical protein